MRLLFASDVHGYPGAFRRFAELLSGPYDCGVIGGDNNPDALSLAEIQTRVGLSDDDLIEELPSLDDDYSSYMEKVSIVSYLEEALQALADETLRLLDTAGKPVFLITGNHDISVWKSTGNVRVLNNGRRARFRGHTFVGYQKTTLDTDRERLEVEIRRLRRKVTRKTILVTHTPPWGRLDTTQRGRHAGSPALRDVVEKKAPLLHLFGHIHESAGYEDNAVNGAFWHPRSFYAIDTEGMRVTTIPCEVD